MGSTKSLNRFLGLNNVADPMRGTDVGERTAATWQWQSVADNLDGNDSSGMERRDGYMPFLVGSVTGAFSTFDFSRLYIIDDGALKRVYQDGHTQTLYDGLSGKAYWAEINDVVYLSCGVSKLQIEQDNTVRAWGVATPSQPDITAATGHLFPGFVQACLTYVDEFGREGGACPAAGIHVVNGGFTVSNILPLAGYTPHLYVTEPDGTIFYHTASLPRQTDYSVVTPPTGRELTTQFLDGPPEEGGCIAFLGANAYVAEYIHEIDQTVVWFSEAMGYHLFNLTTNYFVIPGEVTQMNGSPTALLITTHTRTFVYNDDVLQQVAEYGAAPGQHADLGSDGKTYFWTKRGLCRISPFENLTEARISFASGIRAGGGIIEKGGYRKYVVVIHQGGDAFNRR